MHKPTNFIGTDVPHRPDTYYGLAKCFAELLANEQPQDLDDPAYLHQGGPFAAVKLGNSGIASMNIVDDTNKV